MVIYYDYILMCYGHIFKWFTAITKFGLRNNTVPDAAN